MMRGQALPSPEKYFSRTAPAYQYVPQRRNPRNTIGKKWGGRVHPSPPRGNAPGGDVNKSSAYFYLTPPADKVISRDCDYVSVCSSVRSLKWKLSTPTLIQTYM